MPPRTSFFHLLPALMLIAVLAALGACTPKPAPVPEARTEPARETAPEIPARAEVPLFKDAWDDPPRTMYSTLPGVKLFSEPRISRACLTRLEQGQEVMRFRVRGSFAYIRVEDTGNSGWVESHLLSDEAPPEGPASKESGPEPISETF